MKKRKTKTTRKSKTVSRKPKAARKPKATAGAGETKLSRNAQIAAHITGNPATAKAIGAEFGLLEHSVRAAISTIKKPIGEGGLGFEVKAEKNSEGVTAYSIIA